MVLILKGELSPSMRPDHRRSDREGEGSVAIGVGVGSLAIGVVVGEIVGSPSS